ncbi:hypothetical protein ABK040_004400 [Willaertia magna]
MGFTLIEFPLCFYSPVIDSKGNFLAITVTPEMKSIPFSFYQMYNTNYAVTLRNKKNDQSRISFTAFKIKTQERYKYVVDISVDLIMPLIKDDHYNIIYLDVKDVGRNLMNTYRFDIFNETGSFSSIIKIFTVNYNKPQYDYIYSRPSILEGLVLNMKLFSTNKITFNKVFKKLLYLTSAVARASVLDDCWKSTVKLLKKLLNQDEDNTEEIIIKLKQNCCRDKEKLSPLLQSLILAVKDKDLYSIWKNLFKSYNLDDKCIKIVSEKIGIEILKGTVDESDTKCGGLFCYELSVVMLDALNVSFKVDPFYFVMLND